MKQPSQKTSGIRPGRPSKESGIDTPADRILDAASRLFLSVGFSDVTTDQLARAASVSKSTIYRYFEDMSGVMQAVVEREGNRFNIGVNLEPATKEELRSSLMTYGTNLLGLLNLSFCRQFDQTMHEQARSHPQIAKIFYDAAYGRSHREVTTLIANGVRNAGLSPCARPEILADNLIAMWEGLAIVRSRLGLEETPFPNPKKWAAHCVGVLFPAIVGK